MLKIFVFTIWFLQFFSICSISMRFDIFEIFQMPILLLSRYSKFWPTSGMFIPGFYIAHATLQDDQWLGLWCSRNMLVWVAWRVRLYFVCVEILIFEIFEAENLTNRQMTDNLLICDISLTIITNSVGNTINL